MKKVSSFKLTLFFLAILAGMCLMFMMILKTERAKQKAAKEAFEQKFSNFNKEYTLSLANVSVLDSVRFELMAETCTHVDYPEELPASGDTMVSYISHDTIFIEYWHNQPQQRNMFRWVKD